MNTIYQKRREAVRPKLTEENLTATQPTDFTFPVLNCTTANVMKVQDIFLFKKTETTFFLRIHGFMKQPKPFGTRKIFSFIQIKSKICGTI